MLLTYAWALIRERKRYTLLLKRSTETIIVCNPAGRIKENIGNTVSANRVHDMFNNDWEIDQALGTLCAMGNGREVHLDITCHNNDGESFLSSQLSEHAS